MADVARAAGVSTATVSHVLNGSRKLSAETEQRVQHAIAELGYIPDQFARTLRTGSSGIVGLAMSAITNPHFAIVAQGLERGFTGIGKSILLADTHDDPRLEARAVEELISRRVDGLVLAPSSSPGHAINLAKRYKVPLVLIDRLGSEHECDQVGVENVEPVEIITRHLIELGHTRIGMVSGLPGISTSDERIEGFTRAHRVAGLPVDPALIATGHSTTAGAYDSADALLSSAHRPTALVTANNAMTIGALRALGARNLRVPHDVAVVCFDDFEWADLFTPALTAVAQPVAEIARQAVEMLRTRSLDPSLPVRVQILRPTIAHRSSCGCTTPEPLLLSSER